VLVLLTESFMLYAVETAFLKSGTGVQEMLRFCLSNLNDYWYY
jgi:hypothetical protein